MSVEMILQGVGPLARRLHQRHGRLWFERVDEEVTGPQFTVLAVLQTEGELDHSLLAEKSGLDKSTLTPLLNRLADKGYLEVGSRAADRRRKVVSITPKGLDMVARLIPLASKVVEDLLAPLGADERVKFLELLQRVVAE